MGKVVIDFRSCKWLLVLTGFSVRQNLKYDKKRDKCKREQEQIKSTSLCSESTINVFVPSLLWTSSRAIVKYFSFYYSLDQSRNRCGQSTIDGSMP